MEKFSMVPGASYCVQTSNQTDINFYTFDGNFIATSSLESLPFHKDSRLRLIVNRLDPDAPKPQPVTCKIQPGQRQTDWAICFYDKNGHPVKRYRYDKEKSEIIVLFMEGARHFQFDQSNPTTIDPDFPLDLSNITTILLVK